jgi:hypothetical protein
MRARLLKPGFFTNERLARLPVRARLLFAGLWCLADREGRLEYRPERIRAAIFPYEPRVKIESLIRALELDEFVKRYTSAHTRCLALPRFAQHQRPHPHEPESNLPAPPLHVTTTTNHAGLDPVARSGKDQDQKITAAARRFSIPPFKVYAAIAARAFADLPHADLVEVREQFKTLCAQQRLPYDSALTTRAIDAAHAAGPRRRSG